MVLNEYVIVYEIFLCKEMKVNIHLVIEKGKKRGMSS